MLMIGLIFSTTHYMRKQNTTKMNQKNNFDKYEVDRAVMDFISGNTNTAAAKGLTNSICNMQSLWLLAKMASNVRKCNND